MHKFLASFRTFKHIFGVFQQTVSKHQTMIQKKENQWNFKAIFYYVTEAFPMKYISGSKLLKLIRLNLLKDHRILFKNNIFGSIR